MLKLKKVQILGFKSFCDRTELKFPGEGIAAVVGPNGCGKSNIADAISWVLGEQSAKSLRGIRMEDVIFAGTRDRKPTGMAEVSLTLIDPQVFEGQLGSELEIDIQDEMPEDDWDEASVRATAADATEAAVAEVQPGPLDTVGDAAVELSGDDQSPVSSDSESAAQSSDAQIEPAEPQTESVPEAVAPNAEAAVNAGNPVVLKIRRRKFKPMHFAKGEMMVTRRLFRTGESEYLLNGKLCRLRDIQDIFMGTGLGPESYAIIEQGRIGQILSSRPHDRRAIIEEAAGITKFKTKKRLAEARLEQSKLNLARINDIFEEVTRQMNSLKRQASKAERYVRLRDEMREKLKVVLASKFAQMGRDEAALHSSMEEIVTEIRSRSEALAVLESEQSERTQRGYAIENEVAQNRQAQNAIALEIDRATSRRAHNQERCAELDVRTVAAEAELERAHTQLISLVAELQSNREFAESAAAEVAAAQHEWEMRQQHAQSAGTDVADVERRQEASRQAVLEVMSSASQIRNQMIQTEEAMAALGREAQRLEREIAAAQLDIETFGGKRGQIAFEFESVTQSVTALTARIDDIRRQIEGKRKEEEDGKQHLDVLRAEYATAQGKRSSLEAVINEHGYSTESVKRLFQSRGAAQGFTPAGVLADFLEVETRYESVVEEFLRDELNFVVVKSWDAANEGMRLLQTDVDGRATFLVHPEDAQAKFSFAVNDLPSPGRSPAELVPLKNCIRVLNGFGRSLEVVLPKLRDGYITPDNSIARNLALENPDAYFLSPTGECFHNVTVTGGKQRSEGPLSLKRELREALKVQAELEIAMLNEQNRVQLLGRELSELSKLLSHLEEERREAEKQALTSSHALQQMETELARTSQRLGTYQVELDRNRSEFSEKQSSVAEKREQAEGMERKRQALEEEIKAAQEQLALLKTARDTAAHTVAEAAARLAGLEERRRSAASALERIESLSNEASQRVEALQTQIQSAIAEKQQREGENFEIATRLDALALEKTSAEAAGEQLRVESDQVRARITEIEHELKAARLELDATRERKADLGQQLAKLQSDLAHMGELCLNELNIAAEELRANDQIALVEGEQLVADETAYREMRTKLENMGPVNMMALEEFKETEQRHQFLETQRKDLLESIENTQATIKEIDEFSRQKFKEAFERINENFQLTFRKLFAGGQAFMRLTDEINAMESGIDVVASPPGKKLQNVLLLSGGEKALTALALLVGIFQYQPSPFCILDEVDAPLDEANVGRFTDLIRDMAVQTQFIIITHSKKTMAVAPVMYGITMQEPGVSKVVSVKFGHEPAAPAAVSA